MPLDGFLLDVQPDFDRNRMTSWVLGVGGPRVRVRDRFAPTFYVHGARDDVNHLARTLKTFRSVESLEFENRRLELGRAPLREVLAVTVGRLEEFSRLPKMIDAAGGYRRFTLYNVELSLAQRYMFERGLFPTAHLRLHPGPAFEVDDSRLSTDYPMPPFRQALLSAVPRAARKIPNLQDPVGSATLVTEATGGGEPQVDTVEGEEETVLRGLFASMVRRDPDIVITHGGDSFLLPYLYARARAAGLDEDTFFLGREPQAFKAARRQRSYFSYGKVVYKPAAHTLRGRVHFDRGSSFSFGQSGLWGTVELSRLSGLPLQTTARQSPGTAISSMEVHRAMEDGALVCWKKNVPEEFKGLDQLFLADRGGFIFEPRVGAHSGILELDFTSLYPNIMVKHNLSLETLNCKCCRGGARRVPVLDYHICEREFGLIPRVLGPLVERRTRYKRLKKELKVSDPAAARVFEERCTMLKWVLVTSFGYTGYKNARFGKIECHEAINAFAREIMLKTMRVAEISGFEVLHGIIDSLWLKPRRGACGPEELVRRIEDAIGIQISLEGTYRWIVFLPNKESKVGALNRYYGLFEDGEFKVRGIELRKHDTPPFFREVQTEILRLLSAARDGEAFLRMMPEVDALAERHKARLKAGQVAPADLVYARSVSKSIEEYRQFNHQLACLKQLREHGVEAAAGETVRFVVTNAASRDWKTRVRAAELMDKDTPYDGGFYCREIDRMVSTMFDFARVAPESCR